jgi:hypothetical protein
MGAMRVATWFAESRLTLALTTGDPLPSMTMLAMVVPDSVSVSTPAWFSSVQAEKIDARAKIPAVFKILKFIMP